MWALATLYAAPVGEHLVFKGGTSLSKAYHVIRRFSEDVDLTYDMRVIAPDLVGDDGERLPKTRSEEKRWSSEVRRRLPAWVAETVQPLIAKALAAEDLATAVVAQRQTHRTNKLSRTRRWGACANGIGGTQQYGNYTQRYIELRPAMLKAAVELV